MKHHWNHNHYDEEEVAALQNALGIDQALVKRLLSLGVKTFDEAKAFFRPSIDDLHDPFLMCGMERAATRVVKAVNEGQRILLLGDYDADGVCGVVLLYKFLHKICRVKPVFYIPDRISEGYGLSNDGIAFGKSNDVALLIAIDLGSNQKAHVQATTDAGIDVIICDHHPCNDLELIAQPYALVNPMQPSCAYPNKSLSGCGVAFQLARAISVLKNIPPTTTTRLLDFVAISLATDILPLTGENRILAAFGLNQLNDTEHIGLKTLIAKSTSKPPFTVNDIVFGIGPLLNAPGRMSRAEEAVKALISTDPKEAQIFAQRLFSLNGQRRIFDEKQMKQAISLAKEAQLEPRTPLILYKEDWSAGVIGITAGRLADMHHRPTIIFARHDDEQYIGSARSGAGINLSVALELTKHLIEAWGGHKHAAGLKIKAKNLSAFRSAFSEVVRAQWADQREKPSLEVVSVLPFERINAAFLRVLKQFGPFGPGNRNPVFLSGKVAMHGPIKAITSRHIRLDLVCCETGIIIPAIVFHRLEAFRAIIPGTPLQVCFNIYDSSFTPGMSLMIQLKDFRTVDNLGDARAE